MSAKLISFASDFFIWTELQKTAQCELFFFPCFQ